MLKTILTFTAMLGASACAPVQHAPTASQPYDLGAAAWLQSRTISFENPTGAHGAGGQAASALGVGRKGAPMRMVAAAESVELAAIGHRHDPPHLDDDAKRSAHSARRSDPRVVGRPWFVECIAAYQENLPDKQRSMLGKLEERARGVLPDDDVRAKATD